MIYSMQRLLILIDLSFLFFLDLIYLFFQLALSSSPLPWHSEASSLHDLSSVQSQLLGGRRGLDKRVCVHSVT